MLINILKTTIRKLLRNRGFFFLNVTGLSIGMAAALAIFVFVAFELSFDDFHKNADRTYRFILERTADGETQDVVNVPATYKSWLGEYVSVESVTRFYRIDYQNVALVNRSGDQGEAIFTDWIFYTDPNFDEVADFGFREGNLNSFNEPFKMILSASVADQLFPGESAVGKTVRANSNVGSQEYEIVGVLQPQPANTDYKFNVLLSMATLTVNEGAELINDENNFNFRTYFTLKKGVSADSFAHEVNTEVVPAGNEDVQWRARIIPITQMHFMPYAMASSGSYETIYALSLIGIFILAIAWVNYVNLSITRAMERAREVGVRKVLGANKRQLAIQFLGEAMVLNLLAAFIAFTLIQVFGPYLEQLGNPMQVSPHQQLVFVFAAIGIVFLGTFLSGIYPAVIMSGYKSSEVIKASFRSRRSNVLLRKGLVVFQFSISLLLIIGTVVLYEQTAFMKNKTLGMEIDDLLVLKSPPGSLNDREFNQRAAAFREDLKTYTFVEQVSAASSIPGEAITWGSSNIAPPGNSDDLIKMVQLIACDEHYFDALDIQQLAGRNYQPGDDTFSRGDVIINEKAVEQFGWNSPEEAIGKQLTGGSMFNELTVIGVVENSHHLSPRFDYEPTLYILSIWANYYLVELDHGDSQSVENLRENLARIESRWDKHFSEAPFDYYFLDNSFDRQFKSDENFSRLLLIFASLAIIIAILGMFGLSAYEVFQRNREIGIRKVLGATASGIIVQMSRSYLILVILSSIIAVPSAYLISQQYLDKFAFAVRPDIMVYLVPVVLVLAIAFLITFLQVRKTASRNPVDSLKYE